MADPLLIGTRGQFSLSHAENVVSSLLAAPPWVDGVYINIRRTSDGVPVLMHDSTVDRTTDGTGDVDSLTLAEIQALEADVGGVTVPTLQEYLEAIRDTLDAEAAADERRPFSAIFLNPRATSLADIQEMHDVAMDGSLSALHDRYIWIFGSVQLDSTGADNLRTVDGLAPLGAWVNAEDSQPDALDAMLARDGQVLLISPVVYADDTDSIDPIVTAGLEAGFARGPSSFDSIGEAFPLAREDPDITYVWTPRADELTDWHAPEPEPEPEPAPEPERGQVATAVVRTQVTWLACDVVTGRRIAELPDVRANVERLLNSYTSTDVVLPNPTGGPGHLPAALLDRATNLIRTMLVLVVNDVPSWAGWVRDRVGGSDAERHIPCVTLEGYLRTRKVRNHTFTQQDVATIAAALADDAEDIAGNGQGLGLIVDAPATGIVRDRTYLATDRQNVYEALRELAGAGLVEFTIDLDWEDNRQQVVQKILRIRPRIGLAAAMPKAKFATRSSAEVTYRLSEDHTDGRYANWVVAYAPGEGDDQPASEPAIDQAALDAGAPIVELHWQPSTSIVDVDTLDEHAQRRLGEVRHGALVWDLTSRWDEYPRLNVDWAIGDDIGWDLVGHRHPAGVQGVGRAIGWSLDTQAGLVRPTLLDPQSIPEAQ